MWQELNFSKVTVLPKKDILIFITDIPICLKHMFKHILCSNADQFFHACILGNFSEIFQIKFRIFWQVLEGLVERFFCQYNHSAFIKRQEEHFSRLLHKVFNLIFLQAAS